MVDLEGRSADSRQIAPVPYRLSLRCEPFGKLVDCVRDASCTPSGSAALPCDQVRYLVSYLGHPEISAKTILVEDPYVDRHWLEEYSGYYATLLDPPRPKATRLHFFDEPWTLDEFKGHLAVAIEGGGENQISGHYLGFAVIRPLPAAPLGRTVLRTYRGVSERCFAPAAITHRVHLAGLTIELEGLPFQQQDQGVAACATTAVWSALTKVIRTDGGRAPTPFSVTVAATDHRVQARAFPALAGLDLDQMATAIHAFGYQPHGGEYLQLLHKRPIDRDRIVEICTTLTLSRYVGVISWSRDDVWLLDAVYDTTDLRRGDVSRPPLLALIPRSPSWIASLEQVRAFRFGDGPLIS